MRIVYLAAFWAFLADQTSKYLIVHTLDLRNRFEIDVIPPLLNFRMGWNRGINFGLLETSRWFLIIAALLVCGLVWRWIRQSPQPRIALISAGILIGGALGNVLDRLLYGAVADFISMSCCGIRNPYSFNIADIAIFFGAFGLILFAKDKKGG